jgi:ribonuclease P protein component
VLPAAHRLRDPEGFRSATREGRRAGSRTLVTHFAPAEGPLAAGFVVSKQVGNAVIRNRVKRRLRHATLELLDAARLPGSGRLVVRALPAAAAASYGELTDDLARCLDRVVTPPA